MGVLNKVSRIIDVTLTDKAKQMLSLNSALNPLDIITRYAFFDDDINYEKVDFSMDPEDPNYPCHFTLEPSPIERAHAFKSRLTSIPPGSAIWNKVFPDDPNYQDGLRVIEVTPHTARLSIDESITVNIQSKNFAKDTGDAIFDDTTAYVVYPKDPSDSQYIELTELVPEDIIPLTPSRDPADPEVS